MDLKKAIQRVAKVCPRKKERAALQVVRFMPAVGEGSPYVFATDGLRSALVKVDLENLPNVLLPSSDLVKAAKDPGNMEVVEAGYGKINLVTEVGNYEIQGLPFDHFPGLPNMPSTYNQIDKSEWAAITKVFHAAAKETDEPDLAVVHFTPDYVEATDKNRLVRVEVGGQWDGLVPASTFKVWPKGEVWYGFTTTHAFFWVGDELRVGHLLHSPSYPQTAKVVPGEHIGPHIVVPTRQVYEAVKQGAELSDLGMVTISIKDRLTIRAWSENQEASTYEAQVDVYDSTGHEGMLLVTGKYLAEALAQVESLNFQLGFGGVSDPLRIDSGSYIACVWQLVYA